MSVTDTNENQVLNWNKKIQIAIKSYLITLKRLKNPKFQKIILCKRIIMVVALEAYLQPGETSMKELFCVNNYFCKKTPSWIFDWVLNMPLPPSNCNYS